MLISPLLHALHCLESAGLELFVCSSSHCTCGDFTCINKYNNFLRGKSCMDVQPDISEC